MSHDPVTTTSAPPLPQLFQRFTQRLREAVDKDDGPSGDSLAAELAALAKAAAPSIVGNKVQGWETVQPLLLQELRKEEGGPGNLELRDFDLLRHQFERCEHGTTSPTPTHLRELADALVSKYAAIARLSILSDAAAEMMTATRYFFSAGKEGSGAVLDTFQKSINREEKKQAKLLASATAKAQATALAVASARETVKKLADKETVRAERKRKAEADKAERKRKAAAKAEAKKARYMIESKARTDARMAELNARRAKDDPDAKKQIKPLERDWHQSQEVETKADKTHPKAQPSAETLAANAARLAKKSDWIAKYQHSRKIHANTSLLPSYPSSSYAAALAPRSQGNGRKPPC